LKNHVVWVLNDLKGYVMGLAKTYSPIDVGNRATLWDRLDEEIL